MDRSEITKFINYNNNKYDCNDLYKKLENKIEKNKLDKLIFELDYSDQKENDGFIDFSSNNLKNVLVNYTYNNPDKLMSSIETKKDLELICDALKEIDDEKKQERILSQKDIPAQILEQLPLEIDYKFEKIDNTYKVIDSSGNYTIYTDTGKAIHSFYKDDDTISETYYDDDGYAAQSISNYPNGLKVISEPSKPFTYEYGKTRCLYEEEPYIQEFTVNNGLPNETTFEVRYNENYEAIDVVSKDADPVIKIDKKNKNILLGYINSHDGTQYFGGKFDITSDGISVNVNPIFADNLNPPESINNEIKNLIAEGKTKDYNLRLLDDGRYELSITSLHGLDYKGDGKHIIFSPDGKSKTTYYTEGDTITITTEQNGETKVETYNRKEFFSQEFNENDPVKSYYLGTIRDYYSSDFEDYFDLESRSDDYREEIIAHSFKLEDYREIKNMVSVISKKDFVSDTEYTQTIDNTKYTVTKADNSISVTVNGQTYQIDLTGIHENIQQTLFNANPKALARIAEQNIKLKIIDGTDNGYYDPETKTICMNPEIQNAGKFLRSLVHETGHSYYTHVNPVNEELEATYKKELEYFKANCGSKNLKPKDNCAYAASNVYEMVAECYTLLTNGNAKSEYVIANYFPETLKLVKAMIG